VIKLLLLTGCRCDEIGELEWSEVSADNDVISLPSSRTKNRRPHIVSVPAVGRDLIAAQPRTGRFVFSRSGGLAPISGWSKAKERVDKAAGIATPWKIHDLRRTAATKMAELGVSPHIVEAALNHVSGSKGGIAGVYNRHQYAAERKAALELWASHLQGIVSGTKKVVSIHGGRR
jgi:integrase